MEAPKALFWPDIAADGRGSTQVVALVLPTLHVSGGRIQAPLFDRFTHVRACVAVGHSRWLHNTHRWRDAVVPCLHGEVMRRNETRGVHVWKQRRSPSLITTAGSGGKRHQCSNSCFTGLVGPAARNSLRQRLVAENPIVITNWTGVVPTQVLQCSCSEASSRHPRPAAR